MSATLTPSPRRRATSNRAGRKPGRHQPCRTLASTMRPGPESPPARAEGFVGPHPRASALGYSMPPAFAGSLGCLLSGLACVRNVPPAILCRPPSRARFGTRLMELACLKHGLSATICRPLRGLLHGVGEAGAGSVQRFSRSHRGWLASPTCTQNEPPQSPDRLVLFLYGEDVTLPRGRPCLPGGRSPRQAR
jgi:hypothetical protein